MKNDARPHSPNPLPRHHVQTDAATSDGRASSRMEWLQSLKVGDVVAVWIAGVRKADAVITSAPRTFVAIGKYVGRSTFSRRDGMLASKNYRRHLFKIGPTDGERP